MERENTRLENDTRWSCCVDEPGLILGEGFLVPVWKIKLVSLITFITG